MKRYQFPGFSPLSSSGVSGKLIAIQQAHLEHHKRYPKQAQLRRKEGTVYISFSVDWQGNIHKAKLEKSNFIRSLDKESLALLVRAEPLPVPPSKAGDGPVELVVPVQILFNKVTFSWKQQVSTWKNTN